LNDSDRFFFVHVMKSAGTALTRALREQFLSEEVYPCLGIDVDSVSDVVPYLNVPHLLALPAARRSEIRVYTGHFPYFARDGLDPSLTTFSLLRDPVDRTLSALKHFKRSDPYRELPLEAIYENRQLFRFFVENHQTKVFALSRDDNEVAINCAYDVDDARFARACENLERVDVLGITERYGDFVETLRVRFGWWPHGLDVRPEVNVSTEPWDVPMRFRERIAADNAYDMAFYARAKDLIAAASAR